MTMGKSIVLLNLWVVDTWELGYIFLSQECNWDQRWHTFWFPCLCSHSRAGVSHV